MEQAIEFPKVAEILQEIRDSLKEQNGLLKELVAIQKFRREDARETSPFGDGKLTSTLRGNLKDHDDSGRGGSAEADSQREERNVSLPHRKRHYLPFRPASWADSKRQALPWRLALPRNRIAYYLSKENLERTFALQESVELWEPQPQNGVAGPAWKYWRPVDEDMYHACPLRGRPDYIPPWELRECGGKWYHIDDMDMSDPVTNLVSGKEGEDDVPYSFMPPAQNSPTGEVIMASAGLTVNVNDLHHCLGDLYSVPPDSRIPLTFERNELRLKCTAGEIQEYLQQIQTLFKELRSKKGYFLVRDFDEFMGFTTYESDGSGECIPEQKHPYWRAVQPALLAEERKIRIGTSRINFESLCADAPPYFAASRCWYRLIHCQGLASAVGSRISESSNRSEDAQKIWSLLIYASQKHPRLCPDLTSVVSEMFDLHLFCPRFRGTDNPYLSRWKAFHITWFQLLRDEQREEIQTSTWKTGVLYGSKNEVHIRETAFTVGYFPQRGTEDAEDPLPEHDMNSLLESGSCFWTIFLLTPTHMADAKERANWPPSVILDLIERGLAEAADSWAGIGAYFDSILDDQAAIVDPVKHDRLLFDDDTFSRSRRYFWAVDSLEVFRTQIGDTLQEWNNFWASREELIRMFEEAHRLRLKYMEDHGEAELIYPKGGEEPSVYTSLRRVLIQIGRLKDQDAQFEVFFKKTLALREGLFNASSVIESRAATRLGENVKLLTYVSIFYLPLAFCAAIWSINQSYSFLHFGITTVAIALTTYLMVANLEIVVTAAKSLYSLVKHPIVTRMMDDPQEKWASRGTAFFSFRPEREKAEPSGWYVLWFAIVEILRKLGILKPKAGQESITATSDQAKETASPHSEPQSQRDDKGKGIIGRTELTRQSEDQTGIISDIVEEVNVRGGAAQSATWSGVHIPQWFWGGKRCIKGRGDPEKGRPTG